MKPKDQMKTALLICALTSMSPAFANGTMVKADNLTPPSPSENGCFGMYHIGQNRYHDST